MEKYLVFELEKIEYGMINKSYLSGDAIKVPCFKFIDEFDTEVRAKDVATLHAIENRVRTVVIKGSVFGD